MNEEYKVRLFMDNTYEVYFVTHDSESFRSDEYVCFQGSLADCEAWIRLTEGGYM